MHRLQSSFSLLVPFVLSVTTATTTTGLHSAYTRSLSACLESPSMLVEDDGNPDGTQLLCTLENVCALFNRCAVARLNLASVQLGPYLSHVIEGALRSTQSTCPCMLEARLWGTASSLAVSGIAS